MSGASANVPLDIRDGVSRRDENWAVILAAAASERGLHKGSKRDIHLGMGMTVTPWQLSPPLSLSRNPTLEKAHPKGTSLYEGSQISLHLRRVKLDYA